MVKRQRGGRRTLQEKFDERKREGIEGCEWLDTYGAAILLDRTIGQWKSLVRQRLVPPACRLTRPHQWKRTDLLTWKELQRLGLWLDWISLCQEHGEQVAWAVMIKRLARQMAEINALAEGIA